MPQTREETNLGHETLKRVAVELHKEQSDNDTETFLRDAFLSAPALPVDSEVSIHSALNRSANREHPADPPANKKLYQLTDISVQTAFRRNVREPKPIEIICLRVLHLRTARLLCATRGHVKPYLCARCAGWDLHVQTHSFPRGDSKTMAVDSCAENS